MQATWPVSSPACPETTRTRPIKWPTWQRTKEPVGSSPEASLLSLEQLQQPPWKEDPRQLSQTYFAVHLMRLIFLAHRFKCTAKYVHEGWLGSSFQCGHYSCLRNESEALGLDPTGTFVLHHVCHLMGRVLVVSRQAGLEPCQMACKL